MAKLDLDNPGVRLVGMTVNQVRSLDIQGDGADELMETLDNAQGDVFSGQARETFVVIHVTQ
jgi:hypothetical protein